MSSHGLVQVEAMHDNLAAYRSQVQQAKSSITNLERMQAESLAHTEALQREAADYYNQPMHQFAYQAPLARFSQAPAGHPSYRSSYTPDDYPMVYKRSDEKDLYRPLPPNDDYYEAVRKAERLSAENDRFAAVDHFGRSYTEPQAPSTAGDGRSLFEKYKEAYDKDAIISGIGRQGLPSSNFLAESASKAKKAEASQLKKPEEYTQPFLDFMNENPTVFHAVAYFEEKLGKAGFKKVKFRSSHLTDHY